jgi:hypothetical protein
MYVINKYRKASLEINKISVTILFFKYLWSGLNKDQLLSSSRPSALSGGGLRSFFGLRSLAGRARLLLLLHRLLFLLRAGDVVADGVGVDVTL